MLHDRKTGHMRQPTDASGNRPVIILFTRVPVPGRAKTRLLPVLSAHECALLQEAMILDEAEGLGLLGLDLVIYRSDEADNLADADSVNARFHLRVAEAAPGVRLCVQTGDDLGSRMESAIDAELGRGAPWCMLLGSDLPLVDDNLIYEAIGAFGNEDALLCPSDDGGYWLVGLRRSCPALFEGKRYGTGSVFEEAYHACQSSGMGVAIGPVTRDIDTPDDFAWLCDLVRAKDRRVGVRTAACVRMIAMRMALGASAHDSQ